MLRIQVYNIAKFGNSDSAKFPRSPQKFWPFPWDKKGVKVEADGLSILEQHAKKVALRERLKNN